MLALNNFFSGIMKKKGGGEGGGKKEGRMEDEKKYQFLKQITCYTVGNRKVVN